jgi:hypothetical protein
MPTGGFDSYTRYEFEQMRIKRAMQRKSNYGNSQKKKKTC